MSITGAILADRSGEAIACSVVSDGEANTARAITFFFASLVQKISIGVYCIAPHTFDNVVCCSAIYS